jgi:hypothetical protein
MTVTCAIQSQSAASRKACRIRRCDHGPIICHLAIKNDSRAILDFLKDFRILQRYGGESGAGRQSAIRGRFEKDRHSPIRDAIRS